MDREKGRAGLSDEGGREGYLERRTGLCKGAWDREMERKQEQGYGGGKPGEGQSPSGESV